MEKLKEIIEAKLQASSIQVELYLDSWQEVLQDMQECMFGDDFGDYSYLEQTCMYYERKYLQAAKDRHEYLITATRLGLV